MLVPVKAPCSAIKRWAKARGFADEHIAYIEANATKPVDVQKWRDAISLLRHPMNDVVLNSQLEAILGDEADGFIEYLNNK